MTTMNPLSKQIQQQWQRLSPSQQGFIKAVQLAFNHFMRDGITGTAASGMAYYFIFSLFPLTLLVAVVIGRLVGPVFAQEEITHALSLFLPIDAVNYIHDNLAYVIGGGQSFGWAAVIGLTWSGLGMLGEVTRVLDVIFNVPVPRTLLQQRLIASMMVVILVALLMLLFFTLGLLRLISILSLDKIFWVWVSLRMLPISLSILMLALLFYHIPNCKVEWAAVWPGAITGAVGWELARQFFSWYITHIARYSLVYGSISVVMVLMLWSYLMALVFILAAEVCARLNDWINTDTEHAIMQI